MNPAGPAPLSSHAHEPSAWAAARGLVFLGFRVEWTRRLSDWELNQRHAERWERDFSHWSVDGREIILHLHDAAYFVKLSDGIADFRCGTEAAYLTALRHAGELVGTLVKDRHQKAITSMEAQFLVPWEGPFEQLVGKLDTRLQKPEILSVVNARLFDMAYLVDTRIGGVYYQFNIGPLREQEMPAKIATLLETYPEVATFVSISTRKPFQYEFDDLASYVRQTIGIGNTVIQELLA